MDQTNQFDPVPGTPQPNNAVARYSQATMKWSALSITERYSMLLGVVGVVLIVGMLLAFHHVVSVAVQQGEARRGATAAQFAASARCTAKQGPSAQEACR